MLFPAIISELESHNCLCFIFNFENFRVYYLVSLYGKEPFEKKIISNCYFKINIFISIKMLRKRFYKIIRFLPQSLFFNINYLSFV